MRAKSESQKSAYIPEPGEEELAILIKEAGASARARKQKAMKYHFKKLHAAACDTLASLKPMDSV